MPTPIIIAIDGFSACGKSTLARDLAQCLDYRYIDSGAMYRAVTLYLLDHQIPLDSPPAIQASLTRINIDFKRVDGQNATFLNGKNVETEIRTQRVAEKVSLVAKISQVRRFLVEKQQAMGYQKALVMDGRDIGTVVFPEAELKIFLEADFSIRTNRRHKELKGKGFTYLDPEEVEQNLQQRDHIDSTRKDSPLRKARDAKTLDNSQLSRREQLEIALSWVREITGEAPSASDCG